MFSQDEESLPSDVSGAYASPLLDTDELKMALRARKVSVAFEKRAPDLIWLDAVANQVSIFWRLTAPLEQPTAANIQFFECCMSSYRSPDLNDVLQNSYLEDILPLTVICFPIELLQPIYPHRGYRRHVCLFLTDPDCYSSS